MYKYVQEHVCTRAYARTISTSLKENNTNTRSHAHSHAACARRHKYLRTTLLHDSCSSSPVLVFLLLELSSNPLLFQEDSHDTRKALHASIQRCAQSFACINAKVWTRLHTHEYEGAYKASHSCITSDTYKEAVCGHLLFVLLCRSPRSQADKPYAALKEGQTWFAQSFTHMSTVEQRSYFWTASSRYTLFIISHESCSQSHGRDV